MASFSVTGNLVDVHRKRIYPAEVTVENGKIKAIRETQNAQLLTHNYILPGFIDAHVHIESSMLVPSEFARLAVVHGTVATVSDPHEIANVCGMKGVEFMIANGKTVPFKFHFTAPSCVPATTFETAGAVLDSNDVKKLLENSDIYCLSEMMNFPGVLNEDEEVMKKISAAHHLLKPVDGHEPVWWWNEVCVEYRDEFALCNLQASIERARLESMQPQETRPLRQRPLVVNRDMPFA